ncbi:MAG: helix-turn-helix domain-containing protein [bacterium]|nr:helix-turn-helix domain-containing protein [bacterium]
MIEKLRKDLEEIGLGEKEARVYLALLEHGTLRPHQISQYSGVNRSTAYLTLDSLQKRGIVSCGDHDGAKCYIAESPLHLERILEEEKRRHTIASTRIKDSMPQFFALWNAISHKPSVRYFEGEEGMDQCRELMLQLAVGVETVNAFIHYDEETLLAAKNREQQRLRFSSGRLRMRVLYSIDEGLKEPAFGKNAELRKIISGIPSFHGEVNIFSSFVLLATTQPVITAVILENRAMAELFRSFFEIAWFAAEFHK